MLRQECSTNPLSLEFFRGLACAACALLQDSTASVGGIGDTQPSDKGSPSGEAMRGFEPTQAREGPLLLHKVF